MNRDQAIWWACVLAGVTLSSLVGYAIGTGAEAVAAMIIARLNQRPVLVLVKGGDAEGGERVN